MPRECQLCRVTLWFTEPLSGGYYSRNVSESAYPYPYEAQAGADYEIRALDIAASYTTRKVGGEPFPRDVALVTRTRCVLDEKGQLKSAHYGYIFFHWHPIHAKRMSRVMIGCHLFFKF